MDITPYEQAYLKRLAQYSTVIVFKTSDPKRIEPFIRFISEQYSQLRQKLEKKNIHLSNEIYLFKVWSGLYRVHVNAGITLQPVTPTSQPSSPLANIIAQSSRIRDLNVALGYIDSLLETRYGIVVIFYGLFLRDNNFIAFIRNAVLSPEYYERYHTIVLFTDVPDVVLDEDTLKLCIYCEIKPSTDEERRSLILSTAEEFGIEAKNIDELVLATRGLNLHETESVVLESIFRYRALRPEVLQQYKYDIVRKSGIIDIEEHEYGFDAVGGYDILKQFIINNIVKILRNPEKARKLGLRPPRGILLFGPPGTGKTWLARALAKELGIPFLRLRTEKIASELYGRTERNLARAIAIAESIAPCVFFIDEVDRFGKRAGMVDTDSGTTRRVFTMLLEWLGDARRQSIVVATTNAPEHLDEAFIRVGRFDYIIPVLYPDFKARLEILKVHTQVIRKVPLAHDVKLEIIASKTEYWTGAELEELVLRACRFALQDDAEIVEMRHFEKALQTFKINQEQRMQQLQKYLKLAEEYCNDVQFLEQLKSSYESKTRTEVMKQLLE